MANSDGKVVIETGLDNSGLQKDAKSMAATLAAQYRKAGMDSSAAFKKAWEDVRKMGYTTSKKVGKDLKTNIGGSVQNVCGQLGGLGSVLGSLAATIGTVFSVAAIVNFAKECIELGSNLEEVQNVVDVSFGAMSKRMEEFASTAITQFGMSELAAKKTGSTYMAMAKGLGVAESAAADMSLALTGLSGDVASFYNLDQEDSAKKLQGVFTGETEALKELGVVMTQTNLKQFALAHGMNANIEAMSQAELVALRYAFVTDALSLASGDFVRTQDSWANQTRILSMQWQQFMGIIGQTLTTVLVPVIKVLNTIVSALINVAKAVQSVIVGLFGGSTGAVAEQNAAVAESALAGAAAENELADATKAAGKEAKKALAGFDELNVLQSKTGGSSGSGSGGSTSTGGVSTGTTTVGSEVQDNITPKIEALIEKLKGFGEEIKTAFQPSITAWSDAFSSLAPSIENTGARISTAWTDLKDNSLIPFAGYITTDFIPSIVNDFSTTFAPIFADVMPVVMDTWATDFENSCLLVEQSCEVLQTAYEGVKTAFSDMCQSITNNWNIYGGDLLQGFKDFKEGLWEVWWSIYNNIIDPVMDSCGETLSWLWDEHLKPLWDDIVEFALSVGENILALWNGFIKPVIDWLVTILSPIVTNVINGIVDAVAVVVAVVSDVVGNILTFLDGLIQFIVGVFTLDWDRAWGGVSKMFDGLMNGLGDIVIGVINTIIWAINQLIAAIYSSVAAVVNGLGSIVNTIGDMLGKDWGFSIPNQAPKIPYLAKGAVLPANKPFLAMVGDQKHGTNIEAPLTTIQEAVALVMEDYAAANLAGQEAVVAVLRDILEAVLGIEIGDAVIGQAVQRYNTRMAIVRGG